MTELVHVLQEVLSAIEEERAAAVAAAAAAGPAADSFESALRMADFGCFALAVGRAAGQRDQVRQLLAKLSGAQVTFTLDNDPLVNLIEQWLAADGGKNDGREVSTADLAGDLMTLAHQRGIRAEDLGNTQKLGMKLTHLKDALGERFGMTERRGHANERLMRFYRPRGSGEGAAEPTGRAANAQSHPGSP
jgi:hypothetical protein